MCKIFTIWKNEKKIPTFRYNYRNAYKHARITFRKIWACKDCFLSYNVNILLNLQPLTTVIMVLNTYRWNLLVFGSSWAECASGKKSWAGSWVQVLRFREWAGCKQRTEYKNKKTGWWCNLNYSRSRCKSNRLQNVQCTCSTNYEPDYKLKFVLIPSNTYFITRLCPAI